MLSNMTFNDLLQNFSRQEILFSRGYSFHYLENSVSPCPPPFAHPVPETICLLQCPHHSLRAGAWVLENAQGGNTYHIHIPGSTGLHSGGGEPLHTGHMWELEKNDTEVREINSGTSWSRI